MGNASSSTNEKSPQEESKMSEVADNVKEKVEDAKESISEGVDEVKKRTSNMLKAAKGEAGEVKNTGSRVLGALAVLGFTWGSGYLAAKDDVPAAALLAGEKPTLESKPTHRFIWLQSSYISPSRPGHRHHLRRAELSLQEVVVSWGTD